MSQKKIKGKGMRKYAAGEGTWYKPSKPTSKEEMGSLPEREFRIMIVKISKSFFNLNLFTLIGG